MDTMSVTETQYNHIKSLLTHTENGVVCDEVSWGNIGGNHDSDEEEMIQTLYITFKVNGVTISFELTCEDHEINESDLTTDIYVSENKDRSFIRGFEGDWFFNGDKEGTQELLRYSRQSFGTYHESVAKCVRMIAENTDDLGFH